MLEQLSSIYNMSSGINLGKTFIAILISMVMGYVLSNVYKMYFRENEPADYSIGNSFLVMMPAVTSIFIVIQYSLPLSLGLLGALSFVRFRTPVKRAEDIAFILLAISISLSCAVNYFQLAIFLMLIIFLYSMVRTRFFALNIFTGGKMLITVRDEKAVNFSDIVVALSNNFGTPTIVSSQNTDGYHSIVFTVIGKNADKHDELIHTIREVLGKNINIDIFYPGNELTA